MKKKKKYITYIKVFLNFGCNTSNYLDDLYHNYKVFVYFCY